MKKLAAVLVLILFLCGCGTSSVRTILVENPPDINTKYETKSIYQLKGNIVLNDYAGFAQRYTILGYNQTTLTLHNYITNDAPLAIKQFSSPINRVEISPSGRYAVVEEQNTSATIIHIIDLQTGEDTHVDYLMDKKLYTPAQWSGDEQFISYIKTSDSGKILTMYNRSENRTSEINLNDIAETKLGKDLDLNNVEIQSLFVSGKRFAVLQIARQDGKSFIVVIDAGDLTIYPPQVKNIDSYECASGANRVEVTNGRVYYIDNHNTLYSRQLEGKEQSVIANNVQSFSVSGDEKAIAYTVKKDTADVVYVADIGSAAKLVDVRFNIKNVQFDQSGNRLLIKYTERDESDRVYMFIVIEFEDEYIGSN